MHWLHEIFNPHCELCAEDKKCASCETLRIQLEIANATIAKLTQALVDMTRPQIIEGSAPDSEIKPIMPHIVPWRTRRAMLEKEDRLKFDTMQREKNQAAPIQTKDTKDMSVEELESALDIKEESNG